LVKVVEEEVRLEQVRVGEVLQAVAVVVRQCLGESLMLLIYHQL